MVCDVQFKTVNFDIRLASCLSSASVQIPIFLKEILSKRVSCYVLFPLDPFCMQMGYLENLNISKREGKFRVC